jgi:hypothetical protein
MQIKILLTISGVRTQGVEARMLHVSPEAVLARKRMSEFEELLARFRRQEQSIEEALLRIRRVIAALEQAKAAWGDGPAAAEALESLARTLPKPPDMPLNEPKRSRGIVAPADVAATVRVILSETRRPMKRGELVHELERRGIPMAGKDKNKNLGTILWRHSAEFVHFEKLGYWLKDAPLPGFYEPEE